MILAHGRQFRAGRLRWHLRAGHHFSSAGKLIAIALIRMYNRPCLAWVYNAPPIMVMAYLARFGWIVSGGGDGRHGRRRWRELRDSPPSMAPVPMQTART